MNVERLTELLVASLVENARFAGLDELDSIDELAYETLWNLCDSALIYTEDIVELWADLGYPEPSDGTVEGITAQMSLAIRESVEDDLLSDAIDMANEKLATEKA